MHDVMGKGRAADLPLLSAVVHPGTSGRLWQTSEQLTGVAFPGDCCWSRTAGARCRAVRGEMSQTAVTGRRFSAPAAGRVADVLEVPLWLWAAFAATVVVSLAVDLLSHRTAHVIGFKEAAAWSGLAPT